MLSCLCQSSLALSRRHKTVVSVKIRDGPKYLLCFISAFLWWIFSMFLCTVHAVQWWKWCMSMFTKMQCLLPLPSLTVSITDVAVQNLLVLSLFISWELFLSVYASRCCS